MSGLIPIAHAADAEAFGRAIDPVLQHVVYPIVGVLFTIAVIVFVFGALQLIWKDSDSESRKNGKNAIIGGVIGMFIMLSAWGFIHLISNTISGL